MHIAHFTNTYKPNINGVVRSVSTFRKALTELGHLVFIFAQDVSNYEDEEPFIFRYPAVSIPKFDYSLTIPVSPFISELLPSLKLDVIHSNHPILLGKAAADKAEELELPLVFTFHTRYIEYATQYVPISQAFVRGLIVDELVKYLQRCQHIITPSNSIRRMLEDYGGITERITTIPTGIDLEPYRRADGQAIRRKYNWGEEKVLISIGRLAEEKNWRTLLSAVAQAMSQNPNIRLVILGDGPEREAYQAYAKELGVAEQVTFTGLVPFEEIPNYLKAADIFCFASKTETQGLVTMEAIAAGLPVVAVDASGTSDVVDDGKEALLTKDDDAALAQAIQTLLEDEALFERFKKAAEEKAKEFDLIVHGEKLVKVYEQAIEDKKANRHVEADADRVKRRLEEAEEEEEKSQ